MHAYVDLCRSYGLSPIALIGRGIPSWAQDSSHPDPPKPKGFEPAAGGYGAPPSAANMQYYGQFLTRLAKSFGDKLTAYETWNEPNSLQWFTGTPHQMAQVLMMQHTGLKAGNPDAMVVALSTMRIANSTSCAARTVLDPRTGPAGWDPAFCKVCWLEQVLGNMTQPPSQFWDALSWHPYRLGSGDPGPEAFLPGPRGAIGNNSVRAEMQAVRAAYSGGKELWNTEYGWRIPSKFSQDEPSGYTIYASMPPDEDPRTHTEEAMASNYVQQAATAYSNGVAVQFYFLLDEGAMTDRWEFGMVGRSQAYAKAIYFAAATMIRKTDFAEFRQEQLLGDVWLTTSTRDGVETLLVWKAMGAVDVEIETSAQSLTVSDMFGNAFTLKPRDRKVFLTLTQSPMYIDCKRADLTRVGVATFQLVAHDETVAVGQTTRSFQLQGTAPAGCVGSVQAGFLSANSTERLLTESLNVAVPAHGVVVGEVYESLLWISDPARPERAVGRLASSVNVTSRATSKTEDEELAAVGPTTLSNLHLPRDTTGRQLISGEVDVLAVEVGGVKTYHLYVDD